MPSIVSVNALTAWLRRANDELKREHIHLEIGGDYFLDDMRLVCRSQGLATPVNSMQNQSPSLPDMLSQNNTGFLPAVDYSPGIHDINSHADIVTAGIALVDNALNDPRRVRMQQLRTDIPLETALSGVRTIDYSEGDLGKFFDELQSAGPGAIFLDLEGSKGSAIGISFLRSVADATNSGYNPPELDALRNMLDENLGNPLFKVVVTWVGATGHGSVWNNHTGTFKSILEDKDIHIYYMDDGPNSDFDRLASVMGSTREDIIDNLEVWNLRDITGFYDGTYTARPGYHPGLTALLGWHGLLCHKPKEKDYSQWEEDFDCIKKFGEWIVESKIATKEELDSICSEVKGFVKTEKKEAWKAYQKPLKAELNELLALLDSIKEKANIPELDDWIADLKQSEMFGIFGNFRNCGGKCWEFWKVFASPPFILAQIWGVRVRGPR